MQEQWLSPDNPLASQPSDHQGWKLQLFTREGGRGWSKQGATSGKQLECSSAGVAARVVQMHKEGRHKQLQDFDDHLEHLNR